MSRSVVEKYSQILAQDPSSTVFVELAKAFIDKGDHARAIEVCQQGLSHHPRSVIGRVMWGKALINLGKASEAMNQFDLAVNIDRENAHAYNLIGEVLLRKGLYRSALPILRKAATLQPNDGKVKGWLEQTRAALAGGPAPILADESATPEPEVPLGGPSDFQPTAVIEATSLDSARDDRHPEKKPGVRPKRRDDSAAPTVVTQAYESPTEAVSTAGLDLGGGSPSVHVDLPVIAGELEEPATMAHTLGRTSATQELPATDPRLRRAAHPAPPPPVEEEDPSDPFANVPKRATPESEDVIRGLTSTFDALADGASADPFAAFSGTATASMKAPGAGKKKSAPPPRPEDEPTIIPAQDLLKKDDRAAFGPSGGLLEDVVSAQNDEVPTSESQLPHNYAAPPARAPPLRKSQGSGGLLDEIPDFPEPSASNEVPRQEHHNTQATEAIAKEYERELRAKLAAKTAQKTFLQAHGFKLAVLLGMLVMIAGLVGSFIYTRHKNSGKDLGTALGEGRAFANADTRDQYQASLKSLEAAASMDSGAAEVWALTAYARAMLYAEHTHAGEDKALALSALGHSGVREGYPELALVVEWATSDGAGPAKDKLLTSPLDKSEVHGEAGRVFLADGKMDDAYKQLERAVALLPTNVRALAALGEYYVALEDYEGAIKVLTDVAAKLSPTHPMRTLALAQARLELGRELPDSLTEVLALPPTAQLPMSQRARRDLLQGRLLSATGKHEEALKILVDGSMAYKDKGYEYDMALGGAYRAAGQMERAQRSYDSALKRNPKSDEAKEGLGRVLLARTREKELLADKRLASGSGRNVSLVRGIAYSKLGDWKNARLELTRTQVNGKFPAEAAVYLAVGDATEEGGEKAVAMLEKLATTTKRNKATVQVALARIYMQKGDLTKAKAQLEEAAKDPADYEANAMLGEMLLSLGLPEMAEERLAHAVERNGSHLPARRMLVHTLLVLGKLADALKSAEAGVADNSGADETQSDYAAALYFNGKLQDADKASARAVKGGANDVETWRTRARIQFALGDSKGGMKSLEAANKLNVHDAETFCEIGALYTRQGLFDIASQAYQKAGLEDPKSACAKIGPYHAKPSGGRPAIKELSELSKSASNSWDKALALSSLARVQALGGALKEARSSADEALKLMPFLAVTHYASGVVALRQKDDTKVLEEMARAVELDASFSPGVLAYAERLSLASGDSDSLKRSVQWYEAFLQVSQNDADRNRVERLLPALKKRLQ
jgi:tetratricopeptide (TPR) repeat protein